MLELWSVHMLIFRPTGLQVLLRGTSNSMLIDIACLDSTGAVVAELPAVCSFLAKLYLTQRTIHILPIPCQYVQDLLQSSRRPKPTLAAALFAKACRINNYSCAGCKTGDTRQ